MTINDQSRDENIQYDINRQAAKIAALSSGEICKYEYLTGEDILSSNQQQITEHGKFTYSPSGKAFEKQIKTIEDQGQKQVNALENLKPKEKTKPIENKSNNKSKAAIIFDSLINKRKNLMKELYDNVNYNNLKFEFVGPAKDISFYEYRDSIEFFSAIKDNQINFDVTVKRQNEFNRLRKIKIGKKTIKLKETINKLEKFYISREEVINFFRDYGKMILDAICKPKQNETKGKGLKILTLKQILQRFPIALAQVKAGNHSESLLNEIRQIVYYLYQSKQITKKVYNNIFKSINI